MVRRWVAAAATGSNGSSSRVNGVRQQAASVDVLEQQQQGQQQEQQQPAAQQPRVWTKFVAETLLPTKLGKFRLRGYRHTVDGGLTYTEPSVIISGSPEGCADVAVRVHDACFTSEVGALSMQPPTACVFLPSQRLPALHRLSLPAVCLNLRLPAPAYAPGQAEFPLSPHYYPWLSTSRGRPRPSVPLGCQPRTASPPLLPAVPPLPPRRCWAPSSATAGSSWSWPWSTSGTSRRGWSSTCSRRGAASGWQTRSPPTRCRQGAAGVPGRAQPHGWGPCVGARCVCGARPSMPAHCGSPLSGLKDRMEV